MLNIVAGAPAIDVLDSVGHRATMLAGDVTVWNRAVATVTGPSIEARSEGSTGLHVRIGDCSASAAVHVYRGASTIEDIRVGQHLAVPVRLTAGEMQPFRFGPASFFRIITEPLNAVGHGPRDRVDQTPQLPHFAPRSGRPC